MFKSMQAAGTKPNAISYSSLIGACTYGDKTEVALEVFKSMQAARVKTRRYFLQLNDHRLRKCRSDRGGAGRIQAHASGWGGTQCYFLRLFDRCLRKWRHARKKEDMVVAVPAKQDMVVALLCSFC